MRHSSRGPLGPMSVVQEGSTVLDHHDRLSTDAQTNLYLSHGRLSIDAECIGLGARTYKNHCAPVLRGSHTDFHLTDRGSYGHCSASAEKRIPYHSVTVGRVRV